jgi:hypothetical protein
VCIQRSALRGVGIGTWQRGTCERRVTLPSLTDNSAIPPPGQIFIAYYEILVRNAFGNLRTILKEVSYSGMMASYLTFQDTVSLASSGTLPDENYAREAMQVSHTLHRIVSPTPLTSSHFAVCFGVLIRICTGPLRVGLITTDCH